MGKTESSTIESLKVHNDSLHEDANIRPFSLEPIEMLQRSEASDANDQQLLNPLESQREEEEQKQPAAVRSV